MARASHRGPTETRREPRTPDPRRDPDPSTDEPERPHIAKGTHDDVSAAAQRATRVSRAIDDDIAAVAHDVKTPLSIIMLETNVLEERLDDALTPTVRHGLERIMLNASYIDRLISDLLDLGCHDAGRLQVRVEIVELGELLDRALERAVSTVDRKRVQLEVKQDATITCDPMRIERVVSNLVANALKHGGREAPVTVRLEVERQLARISVIDQGEGMSADDARQVFARYRHGSHSAGYGLGLYISRHIVEAHGGRIGVVSAPGKGSRFYFDLPIAGGD
jgi:signal transduction histidine kinase